MEIKFEKRYLQELYEFGRTSDKKYIYHPDVVKRYQACIKTLEKASKVEDLLPITSFHYEELADKKDKSTIRINDQYRIEFKPIQIFFETVAKICTILKSSKYYK